MVKNTNKYLVFFTKGLVKIITIKSLDNIIHNRRDKNESISKLFKLNRGNRND